MRWADTVPPSLPVGGCNIVGLPQHSSTLASLSLLWATTAANSHHITNLNRLLQFQWRLIKTTMKMLHPKDSFRICGSHGWAPVLLCLSYTNRSACSQEVVLLWATLHWSYSSSPGLTAHLLYSWTSHSTWMTFYISNFPSIRSICSKWFFIYFLCLLLRVKCCKFKAVCCNFCPWNVAFALNFYLCMYVCMYMFCGHKMAKMWKPFISRHESQWTAAHKNVTSEAFVAQKRKVLFLNTKTAYWHISEHNPTERCSPVLNTQSKQSRGLNSCCF